VTKLSENYLAFFFIKMNAQKTQSFGSGMNGESLNSSVLKRSWGCSRAEGSPADEGKCVKPSLNAGSSQLQSWSGSHYG